MSSASPYRPPLKKRLLKSVFVMWAASIVASLMIRVIYLTSRVHKTIAPAALAYTEGGQQGIFCFWHGRMILQPFVKPPRPMRVLMSGHSDGKIIGILMRCFNIAHITGSRTRGGGKALRDMLQVIEAGANITITPDGPRGPLQQAAPGAAYLASRTGLPLIPLSFSSSRHKRLKSWDRFMLPLPFAQICFVVNEPIHVPADATADHLAEMTRQLEMSLNDANAAADRYCGIVA